MSTTSTPNDLTSQLRRRQETDRKQVEETAARELARLGENLSAVANDARVPSRPIRRRRPGGCANSCSGHGCGRWWPA